MCYIIVHAEMNKSSLHSIDSTDSALCFLLIWDNLYGNMRVVGHMNGRHFLGEVLAVPSLVIFICYGLKREAKVHSLVIFIFLAAETFVIFSGSLRIFLFPLVPFTWSR